MELINIYLLKIFQLKYVIIKILLSINRLNVIIFKNISTYKESLYEIKYRTYSSVKVIYRNI